MFKKVIAVVLTALSMFSLAAGQVSAASEESVSAEAAAETAVQSVSNTLAEDEGALVSTYTETVLDDHNGCTTSEYVELTKRFIDYMSSEYAVDTDRIYGTGQSMGCMTTLILASEYPDLYAACMFVDGQ